MLMPRETSTASYSGTGALVTSSLASRVLGRSPRRGLARSFVERCVALVRSRPSVQDFRMVSDSRPNLSVNPDAGKCGGCARRLVGAGYLRR